MNEQHFIHQVIKQVALQPSKVALRIWRDQQWQETTWEGFKSRWEQVASALVQLGHKEGDRVAIMSPNMPEWTIADFGILAAGGSVVPVYPTNTLEQTEYILQDSNCQIMFVGEEPQLKFGLQLLESGKIQTLISFMPVDVKHKGLFDWSSFLDLSVCSDETVISSRLARLNPSTLVTLIYTSGTTGEPKGVMLDAANFIAAFRMHRDRLKVFNDDVSLCFLPLSHVFERAWSYYLLCCGATNVYLSDPSRIQEALAQTAPTLMCSVPRLYEKIHAAIFQKVEAAPLYRRALFHWALAQAYAVFDQTVEGIRPNLWLTAKHRLAQRLVLNKIRQLFGPARVLPCAGASLADDINRFFQSIGVPLNYGYGLTETTATVSCCGDGPSPIGGLGDPLNELQVRISDEGEILVKGATVMRGYFNKPEETAKTIIDGWLHTGDAGRFNEQGKLVLTERIKDLMKTSGGKYIAPQRVEGELIREPLFEQVAVIADARNFVSALIVPAYEALEAHAHQLGLRWQDRAELIELAEIKQLIHERLQTVQINLARFEQVKRFTLMPREFCMTRGELTPTLKLRRKVIETRFAQQIQAMYEDMSVKTLA